MYLDRYPCFKTLTELGYSPDEAGNILRHIETNCPEVELKWRYCSRTRLVGVRDVTCVGAFAT